ncbi:MAG TPA: hypothetical protein VGI40_24025 [Pirellulaceae bacterium]
MFDFLFSKFRDLTAPAPAAPRAKRQKRRLSLEALEPRQLMATVSVNANQVVRTTTENLLGVNVSIWADASNQQTQDLVAAAGLQMFRISNGSVTDYTHFNDPPAYTNADTVPRIASFVDALHGRGLVTLDYGSGSPQEGAAELAYLNGSIDNTTPIGTGQIWNTTTNSWTAVDWKTAGYWAGLRAAAPLAQDDGLNYMRLGHTEPFDFHYYEVGNEVYGSWETDHHGQGGDKSKAHDPKSYATFVKSFANFAKKIDPTISLGVCIDDPGAKWNTAVLQALKDQQVTPGFLSDHIYPFRAGHENDSQLLHSVSDPASPFNLKTRSNSEKQLLQQYFGSAGSKVELLVTEFNSVPSVPGKQSISLVEGLFVADMLGSLLQTSYNGAMFWDLRNQYLPTGNNSSSLYGWRTGGDQGLLGRPGPAPITGANIAYPQYYSEQLLSKIVHDGGKVVSVSSNDSNLTTYAVRQTNGNLDLLVINKNPSSTTTGSFQLSGFSPAAKAQVWQYGQAEDNAQKNSTDGSSQLSNFTTNLSLSGNNFSYRFPAYSMTVLELSPKAVQTPPPKQQPPPSKPPPKNNPPPPVTGSSQAVNLASAYNRVGIVADGAKFSRGLDNGAAALSATLVGSSVNTGGVTFTTGPVGKSNVVAAQSQTINLPAGNYKSLSILATAVKGNQANQVFTVHYTDGTSQTFTQSLSDWYTPQHYKGESIALTMPYRNTSAGLRDNRPFNLSSYTFALNSAKSIRSITLPGNQNVEILGMTVSK